MTDETEAADGKIECRIDGGLTHSIQHYLKDRHPSWTVERYRETYPDAPLLSKKALDLVRKKQGEKKATTSPVTGATEAALIMKPMHEVFDLGPVAAAKNGRGDFIQVPTLSTVDPALLDYVPAVDANYVYSIEILKNYLIGFQFAFPMYAWGMHGTGKTTLFEQIAARTNRPVIRVQHSLNTEESHLLGQYVVKNGSTEFQMGPLPFAMLNGLVYIADEYDVALPSVCAVYQPVLEGKPLIIKDAPPEMRVVKPHPNFRFCATGNTNGGGDETGLYQGTQIQNAANYSRFRITEEIGYMEEKLEVAVISGQAGVDKETAGRLVKFAKAVRDAFVAGQIGATVSPRELITAGLMGRFRGGNMVMGLKVAFTNRLSRVDRQTVEQLAQRHFGPST